MYTQPHPDWIRDFIYRHGYPARPVLVPEFVLHLARPGQEAEAALEAELARNHVSSPFWLQAWAGGQALARYILDHPQTVAGRTILDAGCGCGLLALAALESGASRVIALDPDPLALEAVTLNGEWNGLQPETRRGLLQDFPQDAVDTVLMGDLFYTAGLAEANLEWCRSQPRTEILIGDQYRNDLPLAYLDHYRDYMLSVKMIQNEGTDIRSGVFRFNHEKS